MPRTHLVQIEDDELAGEGEQGDEEHDLRLDDALLTRDDVLEVWLTRGRSGGVMISPNSA